MTTRRFLVSGRVQGVFFRASTQQRARQLGLGGTARNLADGRVEVLARGDAQALEELAQWLHEGPTAARVDQVVVEEAPDSAVPSGDFTTG